jgi:hypothetical protein
LLFCGRTSVDNIGYTIYINILIAYIISYDRYESGRSDCNLIPGVLDEVGAEIRASERLHGLVEIILRAEVRKLAIGLMFPLLEKFNMPIKLV